MWFHLLEQGDLAYTREPLCAFRRHREQQSAVNDRAGLATNELLLFYGHYATRPGSSRKVHFSALFALRRSRRKNPGSFPAELFEVEQSLIRQLGNGWYWFHLIRYRVARPFWGLRRWVEKMSVRAELSAGKRAGT